MHARIVRKRGVSFSLVQHRCTELFILNAGGYE
jgi:hypothetical protein